MKKIFNSIFGKVVAASALVAATAKEVKAKSYDFETMANEASGALGSAAAGVLNIVSILVLIIGGIMLLWAFIKRSKNDGQGNDALVGWGIGLIVTFLALQVVKVLISRMTGTNL